MNRTGAVITAAALLRGKTEMRLRYIELFHAVLTTGSLTGAAKDTCQNDAKAKFGM